MHSVSRGLTAAYQRLLLRACAIAGVCAAIFALPCVAADSTESGASVYAPLIDAGFDVTEFTVEVDGRRVPAVIASPPPEKLAAKPVLLLSVGGPQSHLLPPNDQPAKYFLDRGHRVVCMEAPSVASSLLTFGELTLSGPDPSQAFVGDAQAVLDRCFEEKWGSPGRVVATGISRYAYLALRLVAADDRVNFGGGFAPVTDWRALSELVEIKDRPEIAGVRLANYADKLAGKKIFLSIGNHDDRVSTQNCCELFVALSNANREQGFSNALVDFYVTTDPGHRCGDEWFERGMGILLESAEAAPAKN